MAWVLFILLLPIVMYIVLGLLFVIYFFWYLAFVAMRDVVSWLRKKRRR
jgi:hypothetical protein